MRKSFHDSPVVDISLRKFEKPVGSINDVIKKFCISIGLLQPGDSRDVIVDLVLLFIKACKARRVLSIEDVYRHALNVNKKGVSQSNVRRHLFRLKELDIIEHAPEGYRLREWLSFKDLVSDLVKFKVEPTIERIKEYAEFIDNFKQ